MNQPILRARGLTTHLGSPSEPLRAVDGVDIEIRSGETFALLGESGCGKSMTALSLIRLLPESGRIVSGAVQYEGRDLLKLTEAQMRTIRGAGISMIFQEPMTSLNPVLTVGRQITESLICHRSLTAADARREAIELLRAVGIPAPEGRIEEYPHQLSGGMKQRVMVAIALANEPELLIADEPTTALDVTIQAQVLELMRTLQRQRGMSILLITHDLGVVAEMADRVAVMYAGQIVECADRDAFFDTPRHPYSQKLFDSVPGLDKRDRALHVIKGFVPSLRSEFRGCRFAPRCQHVMDRCHQLEPAWSGAQGQRVYCHLYGEDAPRELAADSAAEAPTEQSEPDESYSESLLRSRDLKVHFPIRAGVFRRTVGFVKAVDGIDLDIATGRTLALVGESGCGKTTAGKGLLQLIRPSAGSVWFDGVDLTAMSHAQLRERRTDLQIIFQDPYSSMNPRMLVGDIIMEGMRAQRIGNSAPERRRRMEALLAQVGLSADSAERYPHEFSGGQRQRICIARALALEPKLIVCDEPTSALDVSVQAQILNLLNQLQRRFGISYLFITHNISVVAYLAHEIAVMYLGRIVERGPVDSVLSAPLHPYTRALLSAVPDVSQSRRQSVIRLTGDMPSPANPPAGCHFHPRCPKAAPPCRERYPQPADVAAGHSVSCHLFSAPEIMDEAAHKADNQSPEVGDSPRSGLAAGT